MRRLLRILLLKPILWAAAKFSSKPERERIFKALSSLQDSIEKEPGKKGLVIPFAAAAGKFIIFSDHHKGSRNGADDFAAAESTYLTALSYYHAADFYYINLGDSEELWENYLWQIKKPNQQCFEAEKKFLDHNRYIKIFGNHDLFWDNDPLAGWQLKHIYGEKVKVYEALILKTSIDHPGSQETSSPLTIFLTHGHQGDASSDGNWFSKFFVARIWAPLQAYLRINPNTPAYNAEKKTLHNHLMYEWSARRSNSILITGHTHQPVFASLTHLERLYRNMEQALQAKDEKAIQEAKAGIAQYEKDFTAVAVQYMQMGPTYFNTGCCCYADGDITGIEIADGAIRLVKWSALKGREVLEEMQLEELAGQLCMSDR